MVKNPPSITFKPPAKTELVWSAKASSTKAFRLGTTAAARLNIRPRLKRRILPSRKSAATRGMNRKTLATRRRQPFLPLHNRLLPRRAPTRRLNMLTEQKGLSKPTRKSSPHDWTSLATLAASSAQGNCNLETLTGPYTALLLPPCLLTNPRRKSRWTATSWIRAVVVALMAVAVPMAKPFRPKASVQLPVDCSRESRARFEMNERHTDQMTFMIACRT